jgi:ribosomal protein L19
MRVVTLYPSCNALKGHKKGQKIYEIIGIVGQGDRIKVAIALSVFQTAKQTSCIITCPDRPELFSGSCISMGTDGVAENIAIREAIKAAGFRCDPELQIGDNIENAVKVMSDFLAFSSSDVVAPLGNMSTTYRFEA